MTMVMACFRLLGLQKIISLPQTPDAFINGSLLRILHSDHTWLIILGDYSELSAIYQSHIC